MSTGTNTFPIELIDHIFNFVDNSSLFQLCRCSRLFHALAFPRLTSQHMSRSKIRLWIEQPGWVSHKPMDFEWFDYDKERGKLIFRPKTTEHPYFIFGTRIESPVAIDGLTVVLSPSTDTEGRRIHSVSYKNNTMEGDGRIPTLSITKHQQEENIRKEERVIYPGNITNKQQQQQRTAYSCAWQLEYQMIEQQEDSCMIIPKTFECDLDLLNPTVLETRHNKQSAMLKPSNKNDTTIPVVYWKSVTACAALTD
ncbi:hypothetical protein BDA99DRAFT_54925 [Phascolomyces articulosus]|uniref:F-box domain-containing protein n=1 Tax=Phascolomyces articulosus TaxID=60185 RepID=A0AAD5K1L7_9FUNG|nr:hypothetical protein BDA99DRAFT_54925 [Phascolomyces articulosus]